MASIILILSVVLAGVYWKYIYLPASADIEPDALTEFNLPKGPSIAVLPFVNMSKDPEQEYFCDGITENIILNLARSKELLVIARNSTFAYKNKSINVQQIGRELNTQYLIEGSIQKTNDLIRISVQLIDTESGHHIWSESYDRTFKDIFNLQDEITLEILKAVGIKLIGLGGDRTIFEGITDIDSFIKLGKIRAYFENPTGAGFVSALKNVEEIIASNPEYPHRYDLFAIVYLTAIRYDPKESRIKRLFLASNAIKKSLSLDDNNFVAHQLKGWIFFSKREYDKAILAFKKSLDLNPVNADTYWAMGFALNSADEPSKALENIKIAIRLNPISPPQYLIVLGWSYTLLKKYEKAIEAYKTVLKHHPNHWYAYLYLAIPYDYSGQEESVKIAVKKFLNFVPDYTIATYKKTVFFAKNQEVRLEKAVKALRKAGFSES